MKQEAKLKTAFGRELMKHLPRFQILHFATAGAPDREIVGNGITTRWEMKHATPSFRSPGNQELFCMRLATEGHCRYVIWQETARGTGQRTLIVHPREVHGRRGWTMTPEAWCDGFDHAWLVEQIRRVHE